MSAKWPMVRLGEVLEPVQRPVAVEAVETYRLLGARWYGEGLFIREVRRGAEIQSRQLYRVEVGDFVYNRLFAWKGSFAVTSAEHAGCFVSNEFPCFLVCKTRLDPSFLWYYFRQSKVWDEVLGLSTGGTPTSRNRLKEERLLAMTIPLPPLPEQQALVKRVGCYSRSVERALALLETSESTLPTLVVSVNAALARGRTAPLRDLLTLEEDRVFVEPGVQYPQVGVRSFGKGLFRSGVVTGATTTYRNFNRLYTGAVVLSQVKGWEGAVAVCGQDMAGTYASPEYRTFRCEEGVLDPSYLAALVTTRWFHEKLSMLTRGVGARRERIRVDTFLDLRIEIPSYSDQLKVEKVFSEVPQVGRLHGEISRALDALARSAVASAFEEPV